MSHLPEREDDGGVTSDIEVRLAGLAPEQRDPAQLRLAGTARPAEERLVGPSFTEEQLWFLNRLEPRLEVVGGDRDVISLGGPPLLATHLLSQDRAGARPDARRRPRPPVHVRNAS